MASMASLVSLGSVMVVGPSERSRAFLRRVGLNKRSFRGTKTWHCVSVSVCKYSVSPLTTTTTSTSEHDNSSVSLRGSSSEADFVLKPPTRPVLKSEPLLKKGLEDRTKVIESLGQVLEKAEKLETSSYSSAKREPPDVPQSSSSSSSSTSSSASNSRTNNNTRNSRTSNTATSSNNGEASQKSKTLKSVWRKGDTVASVQKVVKEFTPKPTSEPSSPVTTEQPQQPPSPPPPPPPPQLTAPPRPKLQAKPSVKRAVILKDVGASAVKERKPILVDKFAPKKGPVVDPLIAQAVLAPTKPAPSKFKDDYGRKKTNTNASTGGRRRKVDNNDSDDEDDDDEESSAVSIPGKSGRKGGRKWSKASRKAARLQAARDSAPVKAEILEVSPKGLLIADLAYSLTVSEGEILGYLYSKGMKPDGVQTLDRDIVKMVCREYGVEVIDADPVKLEDMARKKEFIDEDDLDKLQHRPPVITIMGHVDHGKTTLLDCIRKTRVASSEAGGITQGIGAYKVEVPIDGKLQSCVFLDTPGHEAFGAMRARGARVTDIAIIVVAADDGIRPQTKEALAHAKVAGVPIIIAINKIDRDGASPDRVMQELSSIGLMPEDWGGDIPMVQISALKGENVNDLLETVMLVAELQELKANPQRSAKGTVIEAGLDKSKGPLATLIVQNGTLKRGDIVVCGEAFGKVRALFDDGGNRVNEAGPSIPVQVIGLNSVPISGDEFEVVESLDTAREKAASRAESLREERISAKAGDGKVTLSSLASAVASGKLSGIDLHQLNIIMKVDVQGSIEAVKQALQTLPQDNVTLKFLLEATGDVSPSDVDLAVASKAIVLGFNVKAPASVKSYADNKGVEIRLYRVIYVLIDDVRNAMEGLLEPVEEQLKIGEAEVRAVFSSGSGRVAGCMVTEGKVVTGCGVRVVRKGKVVHVGVLDSLRRVKEIVKEVNNGLECGIGAEEFDEWEEGDKIEAFQSVEKRRTLEEASASIAAALEGVQL